MPYRLSVTANTVSQVIARAYEEKHALAPQQWRVIAVLAEGGELTQQELVKATRSDKVTISRAAQALEQRGLLRRVQNAEDARSLRLSLTAAGRTIYDDVVPAALLGQRAVLEGLSVAEQATLEALLARVLAAAEVALRGPPPRKPR